MKTCLNQYYLAATFLFLLNVENSFAAESRTPDAETAEQLESEFGASSSDYLVEPSLSPEETFFRVPLTPPMSPANWAKWAGPMLEKRYTIRSGDTLWSISDKLFGTPYLWPKVWQLNAVFGNAHVIEPGTNLNFNPGNPNSAPGLAADRAKQAQNEYGFLNISFAPPTLLERLESALNSQSDGAIPPFRAFLITDRLPSVDKVPKRRDEGSLYKVGDHFNVPDVKDGTYSIVRWEKFKNISGYRVFWVGVVNVLDGKGHISKAFSEIRQNDLITPKLFLLSPMAIHEETLGEAKRDDIQLITVEEGYRTFAADYMTIGVRFRYDDAGPQPGALLNLMRNDEVVGKALLVDRDRRSGTLWIIESKGEVSAEFQLE